MLQQLPNCQPDVLRDFPKQYWRDISTVMERYGRSPTVRMSELFVTTSLSRFAEPKAFEDGHNFCRSEDGHITHG
jgi:hypothetical protein